MKEHSVRPDHTLRSCLVFSPWKSLSRWFTAAAVWLSINSNWHLLVGAPCHPHAHNTWTYPPSLHRPSYSQLLRFVFAKENRTHTSPEYAHGTSVTPFRHTANDHISFIPRDTCVQTSFCSDVFRLARRMPAPELGQKRPFTWCCIHPVMHVIPISCTHAESAVFHVCIVANNFNLFLPILINMHMWIAHQDSKYP